MRRWLSEIEDYVTIVLAMQGSIGSKPNGSIGVSFRSKPPMSLTPVAMLDYRSAAPDSEEPPVPLSAVTITEVMARDGLRCTWITGQRRGGAFSYFSGDYDPDRRCVAAATGVDYVANRDERDPDNLRSLCTTHRAYLQRREASGRLDPAGWDPHDHIRSLTASIHFLAKWLREEHDESEPTSSTLTSGLHFLRSRIEGCAFAQWVNELFDDLKELHTQARAIAHDAPKPMAHCLEVDCSGMVFWIIREEGGKRVDEARCATCRRVYSGLDLVRLRVAEEVA